MDKNLSQKSTDQQFEQFVQTILQSTIITDEELDEIAESSQLRRCVLNQIADEKARREKHWFFAWRWQTVTAGAFAFLLIAGAAIWFSITPKTEIAAVSNEKTISVLKEEAQPFETKPETAYLNSSGIENMLAPKPREKKSNIKTEKNTLNSKTLRAVNRSDKNAGVKTRQAAKTEFSTEFIALSYLPASESGQVIRVKVPRSMMVSLGVSTNVERSKELISAEVIVGDDGAARAIRFLND
jgi:hypothetical protein